MKRTLAIALAILMLLAILPQGAYVSAKAQTTVNESADISAADGNCAFAANAPVMSDNLPIWDGTVATGFAGGEGTESAPYQIATPAELAYLARQTNSGTDYFNVHFALTADIRLNDTTDFAKWETTAPANEWTPIGARTNDNPVCFNGIFDGQNHTVYGMYVAYNGSYYRGLFGYAAAIIQNVTVAESSVTGNWYSGVIVGEMTNGEITGCKNYGNITGSRGIGGIVGHVVSDKLNEGEEMIGYSIKPTVESCVNYGTVKGNGNSEDISGVVGYCSGLLGGSYGNYIYYDCIISCTNYGSIFGRNNYGYATSGICGYICNGIIRDCANYGFISGQDASAGIVSSGYYCSVKNCVNTAPIVAYDGSAGGITSGGPHRITYCVNSGKITGVTNSGGITADVSYMWYSCLKYCYNVGDVSSKAGSAGGIAGIINGYQYASFDFSYCYNMGNVYGAGENVYTTSLGTGGVVGCLNATNDTSMLSSCYNSGNVTGKCKNVGGIVGLAANVKLYGSTNELTTKIEGCYNVGTVTNASGNPKFDAYTGGALGFSSSDTYGNVASEYVSMSNCYYLNTCTTLRNGFGAALIDGQMRSFDSFEGFDADAWTMEGADFYPYPEIDEMPQAVAHTVRFIDGMTDETIEEAKVLHGSEVPYPVTAPEHEGYTFKAWEGDVTNITEDRTVTATYSIIYYTIIFLSWDDSVVGAQQVPHGGNANPPAAPVREGYTFQYWAPEYALTNVVRDYTVKAYYTCTTHVVRFIDGVTGNEFWNYGSVYHGSDIGSFPTPPNHTSDGYVFTGWDHDGKNITEDISITALYEKIPTYTVTYVDGLTNNTISTQEVESGKDATPPVAPTHDGYTFTGWDKNGKNITQDTTITAQYQSNAERTYVVSFYDGYTGDFLSKVTVKHGENVTFPTPPEHEGFTFMGWDHDGKNITQDTAIYAMYVENEYVPIIVVFIDGVTNEEIYRTSVEYGEDVSFPEPPTHEGYEFTGWDHDGKNITENTTITALYSGGMLLGDANDDGIINTGDAVLILRECVGIAELTPKQEKAADFNGDGTINTGDAVKVLKYCVGLDEGKANSFFLLSAMRNNP